VSSSCPNLVLQRSDFFFFFFFTCPHSVREAIGKYIREGRYRNSRSVTEDVMQSCGVDADQRKAEQRREAIQAAWLYTNAKSRLKLADAVFGAVDDNVLGDNAEEARAGVEMAGTMGAAHRTAKGGVNMLSRINPVVQGGHYAGQALNGAFARVGGTEALAHVADGMHTTREAIRGTSLARGVAQGAQVAKFGAKGMGFVGKAMGQLAPPMRLALQGHAVYMTGKYLHERNWGAAAKSALDVPLGGTGSVDLLTDAAKLGYGCVRHAQEEQCLQKLGHGVTAAGHALGQGITRTVRCAASSQEFRTCASNVHQVGTKVAAAIDGGARATWRYLQSEHTRNNVNRAISATQRGVQSLGKGETWKNFGRGSVAVAKEIGAIGRDAGAALSKAIPHVAAKATDWARQKIHSLGQKIQWPWGKH
jgi:hypothetical protein